MITTHDIEDSEIFLAGHFKPYNAFVQQKVIAKVIFIAKSIPNLHTLFDALVPPSNRRMSDDIWSAG